MKQTRLLEIIREEIASALKKDELKKSLTLVADMINKYQQNMVKTKH
jgi:uncharacterized membrane protein YgcG